MTDREYDLGRLEAQVEQLQRDVSRLTKLVELNGAQLNRWRGAGAVLILVGASLGWLISFLVDWKN